MAVIAERVRETRSRRGFTAQELADRLKAVGVPWDRGTVTKLETGRRQSVTVVELLALARVLDVAPIHLLVPVDDRPFQVTPNETQAAGRARAWVRGEEPLPGTDRRIFRSEVPLAELPDVLRPQPSPDSVSDMQHIREAYRERTGRELDEEKLIDFMLGGEGRGAGGE